MIFTNSKIPSCTLASSGPYLVNTPLKNSLKAIFIGMLFCIVVLPTGSIYNFNVKLILLVISAPIIALQIFIKPKKEIFFSLLIFAAFVFFLIVWLIIGLTKQETINFYGFLQAKDFLVTFIVTWMGYYLYRTRQVTCNQIFDYILIFHVFYILIKIAVFLFIVFGFIELKHVLSLFDSIFSYKFVSDSYKNFFIRIDLINDVISPFIFLFLLFKDDLRINYGRIRYLIYLLLLINILIGFKRTLMAQYVFFAIISIIFERKHIRKIIYISICTIGLAMALNCTEVNNLIRIRFHSNSQQYSDSIRLEQMSAMSNEFLRNFLIGKGLGGYVENYIRSSKLPYCYEVQWLSFLMQFGILGLIPLTAIFFLPIFPLFFTHKNILNRRSCVIFVGFFSLMVLGFTNPLLVASFCSSFYTILLIFSCEVKNEKNKHLRHSCFV